MATDILRPQNCIGNETLIPPPSRSRTNHNPNSTRSRRRKRSQSNITENNTGRSHNRTVEARSGSKDLVMGEVKILKRGEKLEEVKIGFANNKEDYVLSSTDRLGPDPDTVNEQIRVFNDLYAGSQSMLSSPPPSAVPFPAFFAKKEERIEEATSDLRRLLRLDMV